MYNISFIQNIIMTRTIQQLSDDLILLKRFGQDNSVRLLIQIGIKVNNLDANFKIV